MAVCGAARRATRFVFCCAPSPAKLCVMVSQPAAAPALAGSRYRASQCTGSLVLWKHKRLQSPCPVCNAQSGSGGGELARPCSPGAVCQSFTLFLCIVPYCGAQTAGLVTAGNPVGAENAGGLSAALAEAERSADVYEQAGVPNPVFAV